MDSPKSFSVFSAVVLIRVALHCCCCCCTRRISTRYRNARSSELIFRETFKPDLGAGDVTKMSAWKSAKRGKFRFKSARCALHRSSACTLLCIRAFPLAIKHSTIEFGEDLRQSFSIFSSVLIQKTNFFAERFSFSRKKLEFVFFVFSSSLEWRADSTKFYTLNKQW